MKTYYVTHSKYKVGNKWENELLFTDTNEYCDKACKSGIYSYYHKGEKIWSEEGTPELLNVFSLGKNIEYDYDELCEAFPIYGKYSDGCQAFAKKEYGWY